MTGHQPAASRPFGAVDGALAPLIGTDAGPPAGWSGLPVGWSGLRLGWSGPPVGWSGPRSWWAGPLDVEGLAISSVRLALRAAAIVGAARGRSVSASTSAARVAGNFGSLSHLRVGERPAQSWAPTSGFFATTDGWIRLHANYPHHRDVLTRVLGVRDRDELVQALRGAGALETEQRVRAAGGIAGALRSPEQWRATPMAAAIDSTPWISFGDTGTRAALPRTQDLPLTGVRVLDLTRVLAGPSCTRLLSLLGADVLRVDRPDRPELPDQHLDTGAGKRSATANLRDPAQLTRLHELLTAADVLVTGYRPGALNTLGLGPDEVRARHPHLVHVSLSAWGTQGPWAHERGFDSIVQSCIGIGHTYGSVDADGTWRPGALPVQALDLATGYGMAAAVMGLLATRAERGAGSAALSLAATGRLLLNAGELAERTPQDLAVETMTTPTPEGLLTHVGAPAMIDGRELRVPPPGRYAGSPLSWW